MAMLPSRGPPLCDPRLVSLALISCVELLRRRRECLGPRLLRSVQRGGAVGTRATEEHVVPDSLVPDSR